MAPKMLSKNLLEAMSYGNCCLVSDIPENTEVIGECGVSFKHGNVEDLKNTLEHLLQNPDLVEDYRNRSQEYICSKYSWDEMTEKTLKIYTDVKKK